MVALGSNLERPREAIVSNARIGRQQVTNGIRAVIHNNQFQIWIVLGPKAMQCTGHKFRPVPGQHDTTYERLTGGNSGRNRGGPRTPQMGKIRSGQDQGGRSKVRTSITPAVSAIAGLFPSKLPGAKSVLIAALARFKAPSFLDLPPPGQCNAFNIG